MRPGVNLYCRRSRDGGYQRTVPLRRAAPAAASLRHPVSETMYALKQLIHPTQAPPQQQHRWVFRAARHGAPARELAVRNQDVARHYYKHCDFPICSFASYFGWPCMASISSQRRT
jgi:hypothetical protein